MADHLESVKALASNYRRWSKASEEEGETAKAARQRRYAEQLEGVTAELETARARLQPIPSSYGDLSDLPREVLDQLNLTRVDELEQQLRDIVASGDGAEVGLDPIIIELYRRHQAVHPRRFIMNKLYRMAQKGLIDSVEGRKGVYALPRVSKPSAFSDFDDLDSEVPF